MRRISVFFGKAVCALALLLVANIPWTLAAQEKPSAAESQEQPSSRIDLSAIGFHEPSRMDRIAEYQPSVSLDYVDSDHVLLTFNRKQLIHRMYSRPPRPAYACGHPRDPER